MPAPAVWCLGSSSPPVLQSPAHQRLIPARIPTHPSPPVPWRSSLVHQQLNPELRALVHCGQIPTGAHHKSEKPTGIYLSFPTISAPNLRGDLADRSSSRHLPTGLPPTAHGSTLFCGVLTLVLTLCQFSLQVVDTLAVTTWGSRRLVPVDDEELLRQKAGPRCRNQPASRGHLSTDPPAPPAPGDGVSLARIPRAPQLIESRLSFLVSPSRGFLAFVVVHRLVPSARASDRLIRGQDKGETFRSRPSTAPPVASTTHIKAQDIPG